MRHITQHRRTMRHITQHRITMLFQDQLIFGELEQELKWSQTQINWLPKHLPQWYQGEWLTIHCPTQHPPLEYPIQSFSAQMPPSDDDHTSYQTARRNLIIWNTVKRTLSIVDTLLNQTMIYNPIWIYIANNTLYSSQKCGQPPNST